MDDGEELAREVISENPPEDRGVRPEWERHQGWHRVEDTHRHSPDEGGQEEKLHIDLDQDLGGNHAVRAATGNNVNDDDPLEPLDERKSDVQTQNSVLEGRLGGLPRTLRGADNEGGRDTQAPNIRKPLTIGLAAVMFFVYVTFQRRRFMKSTKDML